LGLTTRSFYYQCYYRPSLTGETRIQPLEAGSSHTGDGVLNATFPMGFAMLYNQGEMYRED